MNQTRKQINIIVPFLNEEENVPVLYQRLVDVLSKEPEAFRVIFVDDGSTDGTTEWISETAKGDDHICLLRLSRNFGHQIAITAGMDYASGDAIIIMDADLQDPPEVIPDLLQQWREGYQVVYAVRKKREGETWLKKFLAASFYKLFHFLARIDVPMDAGDFRLVDKKVVDALRDVRELHRFMRGLTCWVGFKQTAVYYNRAARHAGDTKYPIWKSARLAWDAITSFSSIPLKWVTNFGMLLALLGLLDVIYIIYGRIVTPDGFVWGWTTIVSLILLIGGIQLVSLGIFGQYLGRIFEETKRRPLYFISEKVGDLNDE